MASSETPTDQTVSGVAIPDEEYHRIYELASPNKRGVSLTNKAGEKHRFFIKDKKLYSSMLNDGKTLTREVFKLSEVNNDARASYRAWVYANLKEKNPTVDDTLLQYRADLLTEANESVKNLIRKGYEPTVAHQLVTQMLNTIEFPSPPKTTPSEVAEIPAETK